MDQRSHEPSMNARADRPSKYVTETQMPRLDLWAKLAERRKPASFELETTARCNNDCRHCYINLPENDAEAEAKELTLSETLDIARQATELGAVWCLVTGGEPLLRDDFADLYLGLKKLGLLVSVFTNACLVTPEHVELFGRYPPRDIEVTVYGATEATYERVTRRKGSFAAFRRGLDLLLDGGVPVRLKAMALRSNVHEFDEMAAFCRKHTKDYYRFDPLIHLRYDGDPRRNEEIRGERLTPREIAELERRDPERLSYMREHCHELIEDSPGVGRSQRPLHVRSGARVLHRHLRRPLAPVLGPGSPRLRLRSAFRQPEGGMVRVHPLRTEPALL